MVTPKINSSKLKDAIDKFGSLQNALEAIQNEKLALTKDNNQLKQENARLKLNKENLLAEVTNLEGELNSHKTKLKLILDNIEHYQRQYELFEGFLAMVIGSPSASDSVQALINSLQKLQDTGWQSLKTVEVLRTLFIRATMGDFLKCFRCDSCGAQFIVNGRPNKYFLNYYGCPVCHMSNVQPDDFFLKALVSEEQIEKVRFAEQLQKKNDELQAFKLFSNFKCKICGQPVTEWTEQNLKKGIEGFGWGHVACWNTATGQAIQLAKLFKEVIQK